MGSFIVHYSIVDKVGNGHTVKSVESGYLEDVVAIVNKAMLTRRRDAYKAEIFTYDDHLLLEVAR